MHCDVNVKGKTDGVKCFFCLTVLQQQEAFKIARICFVSVVWLDPSGWIPLGGYPLTSCVFLSLEPLS